MYDSYGTEAVRLYVNHYEKAGIVENVVWIFASGFFVQILASLFATVALRVDGSIRWTWSAVLWPRWLMIALETMFIVAALRVLTDRRGTVLFVAFQYTLTVAFQVLVALRLDGRMSPAWTWRGAFAPLLAFEFVNILHVAIVEISPQGFTVQTAGYRRAFVGGYVGFALRQVLRPVVRTGFELVILLKIENALGAQWTWSRCVLPFLPFSLLDMLLVSANVRLSIDRAEREAAITRAEAARLRGSATYYAVLRFILVALVSMTFVLLCAKLDGYLRLSLRVVFVPVWIILVGLFFATPTTLSSLFLSPTLGLDELQHWRTNDETSPLIAADEPGAETQEEQSLL